MQQYTTLILPDVNILILQITMLKLTLKLVKVTDNKLITRPEL